MPEYYDYKARNKLKSRLPFTITNLKQDMFKRNNKRLVDAPFSARFQAGIGNINFNRRAKH